MNMKIFILQKNQLYFMCIIKLLDFERDKSMNERLSNGNGT